MFFYTHRVQLPALEFESSVFHQNQLEVSSLEIQISRPTPLTQVSGSFPDFFLHLSWPLGLAEAPDPHILHLSPFLQAINPSASTAGSTPGSIPDLSTSLPKATAWP